MKKFCTKCGREFIAVGREVICHACKQAAAEETKRAAVERAKRASWNGESVPVRISGRASTVIRAYGAEKGLPFQAALDALLKASSFFQAAGKAWEEVEPYRSHRRDKSTTESTTETAQDVQAAKQEVKQDKPEAPEKPVKPIKTAAKVASKTTSKASTSKKASSKPSKTASVKKEG